jgi:hypothetical protein
LIWSKKTLQAKGGTVETKEIIKSQYHASLEMLRQAIIKCPASLWNDQEPKNKFWHISYHALFYTRLYLQDSEKEFVPWSKHRNEYQFLGPLPWPPHKEPASSEPYSKEEILEYLEVCLNQVNEKVTSMDMDGPSGFHWLPFSKMELQFYNIRHIQHHAGVLCDRLRNAENVGVDWVGMKPSI